MTNLTASRTTYRTCLTYTVAWEIILMNVMLGGLNTKSIQHLLITY